jgi:Transcriptional regulators
MVNLIAYNQFEYGENNMADKYDVLKLENQLCFPLYACSKEIVKRYKPFLDEIDLTYTQYITMMVLWEYKRMNVKELGKFLFLDSGTLTPVLKKLEQKGYLTRSRAGDDERVLNVTVTQEGEKLKDKATEVPAKIGKCINITSNEVKQLYELLYKVLGSLQE